MLEFLLKENIQFVDKFDNWQEAIKICCQPLIEQGYCSKEYPLGIIQNTLDMGPYYVLCENFALLHARSEQGAIKTQISVIITREPLKFKPDGFDVRIFLTLVASDSEAHMSMLQTVSNIFGDVSKIQEILDAQDQDAVYNLFVSNS